MRVLLLSAYGAGSHVQWHRALLALFPQWEWQDLTLPPRHFSWRVRGNALYWAQEKRAILESDYDLLIATSLVDLATLRGLVPRLAQLPCAVYFHENQFAYPRREGQQGILEAQITSVYTAICADRLLFNSRYNLETFLAGCDALLQRMPDFVPSDIAGQLRRKATVIAVPLPSALEAGGVAQWPGIAGTYPARPLRVQWLGRLEYDKGAEGLLQLLRALEQTDLDFELAVTGQRFRQLPSEFADIKQQFAHRLVQFGYIEARQDYLSQLRSADLVLSTALHEFQGLAVLEAVAVGCCPIVPARMAYPEIYPQQYCYASSPDDPTAEALAACELILHTSELLANGVADPVDVSAYSSAELASLYEAEFTALASGGHSQ
jgi:glycosyltransferase involved in cell wall biosynthesis